MNHLSSAQKDRSRRNKEDTLTIKTFREVKWMYFNKKEKHPIQNNQTANTTHKKVKGYPNVWKSFVSTREFSIQIQPKQNKKQTQTEKWTPFFSEITSKWMNTTTEKERILFYRRKKKSVFVHDWALSINRPHQYKDNIKRYSFTRIDTSNYSQIGLKWKFPKRWTRIKDEGGNYSEILCMANIYLVDWATRV